MKKTFLYFFIFILLIFILPVIFTKKSNSTQISKEELKNIKEESKEEIETKQEDKINNELKYNYKDYNTIKLLHCDTGETEEMQLDDYIVGVVCAEMPANFMEEAIKAQAVVARTYTIYSIMHNKNKHEGADICDDSNCCQAWISKEKRIAKWEENNKEEYWNKIVEAVNSTKGKIITYNGEAIDAFFHSNSGGITETPVNVWGGTNYPYLQSVETSGEDAYTQYSSEVVINKDELINKIKEKHSELEIDFSKEDCISILEYNESGRVKTIKIGNINISGVELRSLIGLKSTNFEFEINGDAIKFYVKGYGHGVGMSQTGADSMAKEGKNYEEIIKHFYTNVEIIDL